MGGLINLTSYVVVLMIKYLEAQLGQEKKREKPV